MVIARHVAERDRCSAEYAVAEVVARVPDRWPRDEIGRKADVVLVLLELTGVRKRDEAAVDQRRDVDARLGARPRIRQRTRCAEGRARAIVRIRERVEQRRVGARALRRRHAVRARREHLRDARRRGEGLALERPRIVDRPNGVLAVLEVGEREPVRCRRPRDRGAELREGDDSANDARELVVLPVHEIVQEDVLPAGAIGDEGDGLRVGRPHRIDVEPILSGNQLDVAAIDVIDRDLPVRKAQIREVRTRTLIRREGDHRSVGRPLRLLVRELIVRQLREILAVRIDRVEIRDAALVAGEDEMLPVRRPARADDAVQRKLDLRDALAPLHIEQVEHFLPAAERGEGERLPIRREGALRIQNSDFLIVRIEGALHEARDSLSGFCVAEPEVDEYLALEEASIRQERDVLAVGRERRREEDLAAADLLRKQWLREVARAVEIRNLRQILHLHRFLPFVAKILERLARFLLEGALDAHGRNVGHDRADDLVAEAAGDVRPQRLAVTIRIVAIGILVHLDDRGQVAVDRGIAHHRGRARVVGAEREILGHTLHEPERRIHLRELGDPAARAPAREDVELELVRHFVREHVLEAAIVAGERH